MTGTTQRAHTMEQCIENCTNCHRICLETAARHFREERPPELEESMVRLLLDCAEICRTSATFLMSGSDLHKLTCGVCAQICQRCATDCERVGDMDACVEACRRCAESCKSMAA